MGVGPTPEGRGRVTLKGFPERWRLFRVSAAELSRRRDGELTPFVGREAERAELRGAMRRAQNGHGGLVMIGGEPRVGKTRLGQEIAAEGRRRGFRVFTGHCYESAADLPFMPWVEMVETATSERRHRSSPGSSASRKTP